CGDYLLAALNALTSCDFLLAAVFLWSTFLATALSIAFIVALNMSCADSSFAAMASLHFLMEVLSADFLIVFLRVFFLMISTLLAADLEFAKPFTSCDLFFSTSDILPRTFSKSKVNKQYDNYF